jgi:hypothetical protein
LARQVTIKSFEKWIADEANVLHVLELIAGGLTLQKTSVKVKQPFTCLHAHFHSTPELEARYLAARKAWVAAKKDEAVEIADSVAPDRDHVAKAKLRIEVIDNQAKAYDRDRWGDRVQVEKDVRVTVDAGPATELLRAAKQRALGDTVTIENTAPVKLAESDAG